MPYFSRLKIGMLPIYHARRDKGAQTTHDTELEEATQSRTQFVVVSY